MFRKNLFYELLSSQVLITWLSPQTEEAAFKKVMWSYSDGSFTTNRKGSRDPRNQWRTSPSILFCAIISFQTSSRLKYVSPSPKQMHELKKSLMNLKINTYSLWILSITKFCFKWKQSKHTWMLLNILRTRRIWYRQCGFIFKFII